jgi:uncharacterized protein (DUF1330 family)
MTKAGTRIVIAAAIVIAALAAVSARQATAAKKAYILVEVDVSNAQQYAEYAKGTPSIVEKYGGRFLARGGRVATLEGAAAAGRLVIVEFPSFERAKEYYESPDYQGVRKLRLGAANFRAVLLEGL